MINPYVLKSWRRTALMLSAVLLVLTLLAAATRGTQAGAPDEAAQFVRVFGDEAIAMLSDPALSPDEREREFRQLLTEGFHLEVIARFVLGRHGAGPARKSAVSSRSCSRTTLWRPTPASSATTRARS